MVHFYKNKMCLPNYCQRSFILLSGHLGELVSNIQKKFFKNIEHSKNEWISSIAMEKALAEDSFKVSNVMEWVKSFNSFFQIHSTALVNMGNGLKNKFEVF